MLINWKMSCLYAGLHVQKAKMQMMKNKKVKDRKEGQAIEY